MTIIELINKGLAECHVEAIKAGAVSPKMPAPTFEGCLEDFGNVKATPYAIRNFIGLMEATCTALVAMNINIRFAPGGQHENHNQNESAGADNCGACEHTGDCGTSSPQTH